MKKVFVLICCLIMVSGCSNKIYNKVVLNVAEVRQNLFTGKTDNIEVSLMSGMREEDYVVNGYCSTPIEFGVLTFKVNNQVVMPEQVNYVLTVGTARYDGVLEHNPFDGSYVADLKRIIDSEDVISAKIIAGEFVDSVELISVTKDFNVDFNQALKIACSELDNSLKQFIENSSFRAECYVKLINDDEILNVYYWYVNFVGVNGNTVSVIIDPITKQIMAKKTV